MTKFAIEHVKENDVTVLEVFTSKDDALKAGAVYRKMYSHNDGIISCIEAEFDSRRRRSGNSFKLYEVWT